jgi:hypothetical protein
VISPRICNISECRNIDPNIPKKPPMKSPNDRKYLCLITLSINENIPIIRANPIRNNSTLSSIFKKSGKVVANSGNTKQCIRHIIDVQIPNLSFILLI